VRAAEAAVDAASDEASDDDLAELTHALLQAEDDLARRAAHLPGAETALVRPDLSRMVALLPDSAVLVAAVQYTHFARAPRGGGARAQEERVVVYAAWRGEGVDGAPRVHRFDLGSRDAVAAACAQHLRSTALQVGRGRPAKSARADDEPLLRHLLGPVLAALPPTTRVLYVCPEGELAGVPWATIECSASAPPGASLLGDRFKVRYIDHPLALEQRPALAGEAACVVFGGIDYEETSGGAPTPERSGGWRPLPGSKREAAAVAGFFRAAYPRAPLVYRDDKQATEEEFRAAVARTRFVHVATHAFADPADARLMHAAARTGVPGVVREQRTGLVFAGSNRPPSTSGDAGILTAFELAQLDLSQCELAVLSACSTNVGERHHGEAVTGLNRALQLAGARYTITSLWAVDDEGAADFFAAFYVALWEQRRSVPEAYDIACRTVRSRGLGVWAAFVLYQSGST
jgi:CHAT domain-containing protein